MRAPNLKTMALAVALFMGSARAADYELPLTSTGFAGLTLLASSFQDAAAVFGSAREDVNKHGLQSFNRVCYTSARKDDGTNLILKSDDAGQGKLLTHFILMSARHQRVGACVASPALHADLSVLDGHLRLGMTKDEVRAAIGDPSVRNLDGWNKDDLPDESRPNSWIYMLTWHAPSDSVDQHALAVLSGGTAVPQHEYAWTQVILNFRRSRLVRIDVSHGVGY